MLQLFSDEHVRIGTLSGFKELCETTELGSGDKSITLQYPSTGPFASEIKNEYYIRTKTDEYVIKSVQGGSRTKWLKVKATLNLEELEGKAFLSFKTTEKTPAECLAEAFAGTGWTVGSCAITKKRTIQKDAPCNALEIVAQVISTYVCEIVYETLEKVVHIHEQIGEDRGSYFVEALNLRRLKTEKTSYEFYTRIIPVGKDGLQIDIEGKNYIEDHTYSSKIKTFIWKDERYNIAEHLIEDATLKLRERAKPYEVYESDVIDLASLNPIYQDILSYDIGDTVWLISKQNGVKKKMRIVKIVKYPQAPHKNTCELSNQKKNLTDVQAEQTTRIVTEMIAAAGSSQ